MKLTIKTPERRHFYCWLWTYFTPFSSVSIVDFKQVTVSWVYASRKVCPNLVINDSNHYSNTAWKVSKYGVISSVYFPAFGLNTERYEVSLRIQSECRIIQTRNNSVFGPFSGSLIFSKMTMVIVRFIAVWKLNIMVFADPSTFPTD